MRPIPGFKGPTFNGRREEGEGIKGRGGKGEGRGKGRRADVGCVKNKGGNELFCRISPNPLPPY